MIINLWEQFLNVLFPETLYCIRCDKPLMPGAKYSLCSSCVRDINWSKGSVCKICGRVLKENSVLKNICNDCNDFKKPFSGGAVCTSYGLFEKDVLKRFKYKEQPYLAKYLGLLMAERVAAEDWQIDFIVSVPLHREKHGKRGYNQAALLASEIGKNLKIECKNNVLKRKISTIPMSRLDNWQRREALKGVFSVNTAVNTDTVEGKNILLVDDIYTTGSTMKECTNVLLKAGAKAVYISAFSATFDKNNIS